MLKSWLGYRHLGVTIHEHNPDFEEHCLRVKELIDAGYAVSTWDED